MWCIQHALLQSSESYDPSKIIFICFLYIIDYRYYLMNNKSGYFAYSEMQKSNNSMSSE